MKVTTTLYPSRMGCPSVPATMKGIIVSMDGVYSVDANYEDRSLAVTFDNEAVSIQDIIKKIGEETGVGVSEDASLWQGGMGNTCPL